MAEIVGAFGVPHTPFYPLWAREDNPRGHELVRLYGEVADRVRQSGPDALVIISTDHFHTFFTDLPTFAIGTAEDTYGPMDQPMLPSYDVGIDRPLARHLLRGAVKSGFDVTVSQEFALDHTFMVPYHFLAAELGIPIIPVFVNGLLAPLPTASRCFQFGEILRSAIEGSGDGKRIAVLASGSFSLDLGGIHPPGGFEGGLPDSAWVDEVVNHLRASEDSDLVQAASDDRMARAGNIGGELLNWITMLGTFDPTPPTFIERQEAIGNAYAAWNF